MNPTEIYSTVAKLTQLSRIVVTGLELSVESVMLFTALTNLKELELATHIYGFRSQEFDKIQETYFPHLDLFCVPFKPLRHD